MTKGNLWLRRWGDWIEKATAKHGGRYQYPGPEKNDEDKVQIVCPDHGPFWQDPKKHLHGQGCGKCAGRGTDKLQDLKDKYPGWNWDGVTVEGSKAPLHLTCPRHGPFTTLYNRLMNRRDTLSVCPACNKAAGGTSQRVQRGTWEDRVKTLYQGRVTLKGETGGCQDKALFECETHGMFEARPLDVVNGHGCPQCGAESRVTGMRDTLAVTSMEFVQRAMTKKAGKGYGYDTSSFTNMRTPMRMYCREHGEFWQIPRNHLTLDAGCPTCASSVSKGEAAVRDWLLSLGETVVVRSREVLAPQEVDIYLPTRKLAIEYCGLYWHGEGYKDKGYHKQKYELAKSKGITLVQVFEDEWISKPEIVKSMLQHKLGASQKEYARLLEVVALSWAEARDFFEANHIGGAGSPTSTCFALVRDGDILQAISWGRGRFDGGDSYEMYRFASKSGMSVVGGLSRLLKKSLQELGPGTYSTYADLRWGQGLGYSQVGFQYRGDTSEGYFWVKQNKRFSRVSMQKHKLAGKLKNYDPNLSESDNCRANGYWKIYDCGHAKWELINGDNTNRPI